MASVDFIEKRIEGKKAEIANLEKKLGRIQKAAESNYEENNPYYYGPRDLRSCTSDLERAKEALEKYEAQLTEENVKAQSRNVPAITEFLDTWEKTTIEYFESEYERYQQATEEYRRDREEYRRRLEEDFPYEARWKKDSEYYQAYHELDREYDKFREAFRAAWTHVTQFDHGTLDWDVTMRKDIAEEKKRKYDFILDRVCSIVGTITDATNLKVGAKGDLNGYIIGTDGKASVQTIGAGGYNMDRIVNEKHGQIFHFRTLIHEIK